MNVYTTTWRSANTQTPWESTHVYRLNVHPENTMQTIEGFGGAFTRSSALVLRNLPNSMRNKALRLYFDPLDGAGFTLCRTPIGGCDFAEYAYTYDDIADDVALRHFSIAPDLDTTIPMILEAKQMAGSAFRLYACPWSPPAWMKDTGRLEFGGRLQKRYYPLMAQYFIRYLDAYAKHGIKLWGLTAQNEPNESLRWPTCLYSAQEEAEFLADHLLPALEHAGYRDLCIMLWDNNKDLVAERVRDSLAAHSIEDRLWGVAFHWYAGDHFDQLAAIHAEYPSLHLLSTESCTPLEDPNAACSPGERYAHEIIGDLNHWACGFIDWNLFLDETGGPSYVKNACVAPLMVYGETLVRTQAYDAIYHFSHFVRPGSKRIAMDSSNAPFESVAFITPDNQVVVIVHNSSDCSRVASLYSETLIVPAHGLVTCVLENPCETMPG